MSIPYKGITASRKEHDKTDFIIANHAKMSRSELSTSLGETPRWVKRQIASLIKEGKISPKREKINPVITIDSWTPEIKKRAIELHEISLKSHAEIAYILKEEFNFEITATVLGTWLRKFGIKGKEKSDWLVDNITYDKALELLSKNMTLVEISRHIKDSYSVYISDDLILTHFKKIGLMSQRQYSNFIINSKGKQFSKEWLSEKINSHVGLIDTANLMGVSTTILQKRMREEGLVSIPHRKVWSNNLDLLRDRLLEVPAIDISDNIFHECMLGWLFGDGHIDTNGRFTVNHSLKQLDYLYLKIRVLKPYLSNIVTVARSNFSNEGICFGGGEQLGISCPGLVKYLKYINPDGSKNVDMLASEMTPLSWACLYMDDGSFYNGVPVISTSIKLCHYLKNRYNFIDHVNDHDLRIKDINSDFIIPGMASKLPGKTVGGFWEKYVPELFDVNIQEDYQLSFLNSYLCGNNPKLLNQAVEYYHKRGFPYFKISKDYLQKEYNKLKLFDSLYLWKSDNVLRYLDVGNHIFKHFMDHMVEAKFRQVSPLETFKNFMQFRSVLEYTLNTKKPILPDFVYNNLIYFNGGVVGFPCSVAKAISDKFCPKNGIVVDPCAGWGGRLLGVTSCCDRSYFGFDIWDKTASCLEKIISELSILNATIINSSFSFNKAPSKCDIVFTSPPYFDLEIYGTSLSKKDWHILMSSIFHYSEKALSTGGHLILNLPRSLKVELPSTPLNELPPIYFHTSSKKKSLDKAEVLYLWQRQC